MFLHVVICGCRAKYKHKSDKVERKYNLKLKFILGISKILKVTNNKVNFKMFCRSYRKYTNFTLLFSASVFSTYSFHKYVDQFPTSYLMEAWGGRGF